MYIKKNGLNSFFFYKTVKHGAINHLGYGFWEMLSPQQLIEQNGRKISHIRQSNVVDIDCVCYLVNDSLVSNFDAILNEMGVSI